MKIQESVPGKECDLKSFVQSLKQFMEKSSLGEYKSRLDLLLAFHLQLVHMQPSQKQGNIYLNVPVVFSIKNIFLFCFYFCNFIFLFSIIILFSFCLCMFHNRYIFLPLYFHNRYYIYIYRAGIICPLEYSSVLQAVFGECGKGNS